MFKEKFNTWLSRKKRKNQPTANGNQSSDRPAGAKKPALTPEIQARQRQRQPFRQQQPVSQKVSKTSGADSV